MQKNFKWICVTVMNSRLFFLTVRISKKNGQLLSLFFCVIRSVTSSAAPLPVGSKIKKFLLPHTAAPGYDMQSYSFTPKPTTTPAPTTTRDPMADFCHGRTDDLYENVADRNTFFQCFHGITYLQRCQPGLVYMDVCKCCNWPWIIRPVNRSQWTR